MVGDEGTEDTKDTVVGDEPGPADPSLAGTVFASESAASSSATPAPPAPRAATPGDEVGRYLILSRLGAGAMGVVLAAYDPELDRKVALKLLKVQRRGGDTEGARARLQREAQALARLNHANVVTIHDVGTHEGQVFIAMEFVDGQTLGEWLGLDEGGPPRPWREVMDVFIAAGNGLAAAHAEGLVHRDFKPDNVMVGSDGRVRVMDFGLARAGEGSPAAMPEDPTRSMSASVSLSAKITRTGAFMGTPAYMAPEQFAGGQVGPASDQFSFCVALYEALYGQRPFAGETVAQIAFAVSQGKMLEPPRGAGIPGWLAAIVRRGLSTEPGDRFPSMDALLEALRSGEAARRRRATLAIVAGLALVGLGLGAVSRVEHRRTIATCEAEGRRIEEVWNDEAATRLRHSSTASGLSYGPATIERAIPYLDAQRDALRDAGTRVCLAHRSEGRWSAELHDRARRCLDERRMELEAVIEQLSSADPGAIRRSVSAVAGLEPVESCLEERSLRRARAVSAAMDEEREVLALLSRSRALDAAGKFSESLDAARSALEHATTVGDPVLMARARILVGEALEEVGEYEDAERSLVEAYFEAAGAEAAPEAAAAATALTYLVGSVRARPDEGMLWSRHARARLDELGEPEDGVLRVRLDDNIASVHFAAGELERARAMHQRVIETRELKVGPNHPSLTASLNNLAVAYARDGYIDRAEELFLRSLELRRTALGPDHPSVANALHNLANVELARENYEGVVPLLEAALAIEEPALGDDHPDVGATLANLASALGELDRHKEALPLARRALSIRQLRFDPDHPSIGSSLDALGNLERETGQWDEAREHHAEALRIREDALGPDDSDLAFSLYGVADVALHDADYRLAISSATRALELREEEDARPFLTAASRFLLAQALWDAPEEQGRDRARARQLGQQAAKELEEHGPGSLLAQAAAGWLEALPDVD